MNKKIITVKKNSGELEPFEIQKLEMSLKNSGATNQEIKTIIKSIYPIIYEGISSDVIYSKAYFLLKKLNNTSASKYSLKRAIFDLGPSGYPFEKLIGALLRQKGYTTKVSEILQGINVNHEIDVLAEKDGNTYIIECKFHSSPKIVCDVKIPLYINSRFLDVQKKWNSSGKATHLKQGWLVTNTRFTEDAINYAKSVDLSLFSWDYPKDNGINKNIDEFGLYPITVLSSLSKQEKMQFIQKDIILVKELLNEPDIFKHFNIPMHRTLKTLDEIKKLCNH
ncbi:restriction endonuclease [Mariniflexile sp.]|uniref:restriction endonuclease n=1 Tax=Mariniflexile sp. TaxID=1979402 RepID=UPI003568E20F